MEREAFFLDSYAIHEIVEGSESYRRFAAKVKVATTILNLMEVYYSYLSKGIDDADAVFDRFRELCIDFLDDDIKDAMKFKRRVREKNPKSNLSYIDALGYIMAIKRGFRFVTGDKEFSGLDNVEFIK